MPLEVRQRLAALFVHSDVQLQEFSTPTFSEIGNKKVWRVGLLGMKTPPPLPKEKTVKMDELLLFHGTDRRGLPSILRDKGFQQITENPGIYGRGTIIYNMPEWDKPAAQKALEGSLNHNLNRCGIVFEAHTVGHHRAGSSASIEELVSDTTFTHYRGDGRWCAKADRLHILAIIVQEDWISPLETPAGAKDQGVWQ